MYGQPMYGAAPSLKQPLYQSATGGFAYSDIENGQQALFPGITVADQTMRWGFIQKVEKSNIAVIFPVVVPFASVEEHLLTAIPLCCLRSSQVYSILCAQMVLTAITCATVGALFPQGRQAFTESRERGSHPARPCPLFTLYAHGKPTLVPSAASDAPRRSLDAPARSLALLSSLSCHCPHCIPSVRLQIMFDPRVQNWVFAHPAFLILSMIVPLIGTPAHSPV